MRSPQACWTGTVAQVDTTDPADNGVVLEPPLPRCRSDRRADPLPQHISSRHNVSDPRPSRAALGAGDLTLVAGFKDARNFAAGVTLFVNPGDRYEVHSLAAWDR